ncbi:hypothetical protein ISS03_03095 [Patescibacteria group bacterium]|nr:hypothetical protein [Patescibacteria group bacterium]
MDKINIHQNKLDNEEELSLEALEDHLTNSLREKVKLENVPIEEMPDWYGKHREISGAIINSLVEKVESFKLALAKMRIRENLSEEDYQKQFFSIGRIERVALGAHEAWNKGKQLGQSGTRGVVYGVSNDPFCYKIIYNIGKNKEAKQEHTRKEYEIQRYLKDLEVKGVKTPRIENVVNYGDYMILQMEQLNAFTVSEVIDFGAPMPKSFNYDVSIDGLESYIKVAHNVDGKFLDKRGRLRRGVRHYDLHLGNVMIDKETGLLRVIDWDASIYAEEDHENIALENDRHHLEEARFNIEHYLNKKKRFEG